MTKRKLRPRSNIYRAPNRWTRRLAPLHDVHGDPTIPEQDVWKSSGAPTSFGASSDDHLHDFQRRE
ncbi:hypothetical protein TIFTF001_019783 [Ficus carica]|uniref:Uncharacterized protein n=1 Tax=Ficus carica TaxID=3494 RepID=A0AA88AEY0_FICCA|nr:hypothetical protein TIFTF001_019783 [Ficus carica]